MTHFLLLCHLQGAVEAINAEKEAKRRIAEKVASLEAYLGEDHALREAELERLLTQVSKTLPLN